MPVEATWHPFTQMLNHAPIQIERGEGAYLFDQDGTAYLDAISSWWVNLHGHAHPAIAEAIAKQAKTLEHVIFAGFTHAPAKELSHQLTSVLPDPITKIFYSDNGSTAVEVALKLALQYWYNIGEERKHIISFKHGYHGDTLGAMSAAGKTIFNRPFWNHLWPVISIDPPYRGFESRSIEQLIKAVHSKKVACFIFEPLIQCVSGMQMHSPRGLDALLRICREYDVITIADEIATGFGRTGPLFASEFLNETPDIICLSKGITGGFLPLGASACKQFIYDAYLSNDPTKTFLHGHSYTANPISCAAALTSLKILKQSSQCRERIADSHRQFCSEWIGHPRLKRCVSLGTILVLEYETPAAADYFNPLKKKLEAHFLKNHILIRPLGNVLYLMPPYCITEKELNSIYQLIIQTLEEDL